MNQEEQSNSHLFTIRIWLDEVDGQTQWRGKLCHIPSGESRYFRGWASLIALILYLLRHYPSAVMPSNGLAVSSIDVSGQPQLVNSQE
jgi:hypothetical protein